MEHNLEINAIKRTREDYQKENMNNILSICIPTFNRADSLNLLLESISKIDLDTSLRIEVCISDNHSCDHTEEVVLKWKKAYQINYIRQMKNIGGSKNQVSVVGLATGKWVIIVGDDDTIEYENMRSLTNMLDQADVINSIFINIDGKYDGPMSSRKSKKMLVETKLRIYGFIGNHIFSRSSFLENLLNIDPSKVLGWSHLYVFLRLASENGVFIYKSNIVKKKGSSTGVEHEDWKHEEWVQLIFMRLKVIKYALSKKSFFLSLVLGFKDIFSSQLMVNLLYYIICSKSNNNKINTLPIVQDYRSEDTTIAHKFTSSMIILIFKGQNILIRVIPFFIYKKILMKIKKVDLSEVCCRSKMNKGIFYRGV